MKFVVFKTEEAIFQFDRKLVMECLEHRKTSYEIKELDLLLDVISSQPEKAILSSAEHPYLGYIALDLINAGEGSAFCKNCGKQYRFNQLEGFTVEPDKSTFKGATAKNRRFKNLFRKRPKLPGMYGGMLYRCPSEHILIYMQTWTT